LSELNVSDFKSKDLEGFMKKEALKADEISPLI
jgi:hypothetical protein